MPKGNWCRNNNEFLVAGSPVWDKRGVTIHKEKGGAQGGGGKKKKQGSDTGKLFIKGEKMGGGPVNGKVVPYTFLRRRRQV